MTGYFTSNRPGGTGDDDIYYFSVAAIDLQVTTFDVTAEGFFPNSVKYTSVGLVPGEYSLTVEMEKLSTGKQFTLDDLFYDLNKSNIRHDAALVLDALAQILLENQEVRIEIGSHTDSRATAEYNLNLSQRRSESVVAYLIGKGVAKDRLVAKGFGESQLINHCADLFQRIAAISFR